MTARAWFLGGCALQALVLVLFGDRGKVIAAASMLLRHGLDHAYFWAVFPHPFWGYLPVLFLAAAFGRST